MVPSKAPNHYHHGDLRRALLQAAVDLVGEVGVQGLSLREVARRAGVTHAAPYRHFPSKESLVAAIAEDGYRTMMRYMQEAQASLGDAPPLQRFYASGNGYLQFALAHPAYFRLMFGATELNRRDYPSLREAAEAAFHLLLDSVVACQESGELKAGDPRELGLAAWSSIHGLASLWVDHQLHHLQLGEIDNCYAVVTRCLLEGAATGPASFARPSQPVTRTQG